MPPQRGSADYELQQDEQHQREHTLGRAHVGTEQHARERGFQRDGDHQVEGIELRLSERYRRQRKTTVLRSLSSTRRSECHFTARDSATASASRPTVARARGL